MCSSESPFPNSYYLYSVIIQGGDFVSKSHNHSRSANDQRSDSKNPTSKEYKDAMDNRSNQIRENKEEGESDE